MRAHRLTISKMNLAMLCSWGFRGDVEAVERPAGRPAQVGNAVHCLAEHAVKGDAADLSKYEPDVEAEARAIFAGPLSGFLASRPWTACEIGVRYDASADTCTQGPRRGEPGYEAERSEVLPGTLDLVHVDGKVAHVWDIKSGRMPEDKEQLYAQAVAVSRLYGVDEVHVAYARALKTKLQADDVERLTADDLDMHAGRIARVLRKLPTAQPVPGDGYCWKCDARGACPAFGAAKAEKDMREMEAAGYFA
jgi:hypothetical protein